MKVESILAQKGTEVITTGPDVGLADAAKLLTDRRIGAVIVTDPPGQVVGIAAGAGQALDGQAIFSPSLQHSPTD